jgi:hypothetical protein
MNLRTPRIAGLLALALGAVALLALSGVATAKDRGGDDHGNHGHHGRHHHHHFREIEEAGTISSFDSATGKLTIALTDGETVSGLVTAETRISCEGADDRRADRRDHGGGDDNGGRGTEPGDDNGARGNEPGDDSAATRALARAARWPKAKAPKPAKRRPARPPRWSPAPSSAMPSCASAPAPRPSRRSSSATTPREGVDGSTAGRGERSRPTGRRVYPRPSG